MKIFSFNSFKFNFKQKNQQEENGKHTPDFSMPIKDNFQKSPKSAEKLGFSGVSAAKTAKLPVAELEKLFADFLQKIADEHDCKKIADLFKEMDSKRISIISERTSDLYYEIITKHVSIRNNIDRKKLEQENFSEKQVKGFLGDLAHETLSGLLVIQGRISATQRKNSFKPLPENFQQICENELNNILNIYKKYQYFIDNKIYSPDFSLSKLLSNSLALVEGKAKNISVEGAELLENTKLDAKNTDLYSLMSNLIGNAAKYSKGEGKINIKFKKVTTPEGKEVLNFIVKDNGIGIPKKDIANITKGQRASNTGEIQGTGYGLNRVAKIMQYLQSKMIIRSQENIGTQITCPLPILSAPKG